ncbi:VHS domain-containing protein [Entamoeba marina]
MHTQKRSVQLSQVFDHAVNEVHPSPYIKGYETLQKIVHSVPQAGSVLKTQLINKMKAYHNHFLPNKEMYYCLCLVDHLVKREAVFRQQVLNPEFMKWFETISEFDKFRAMRKTTGMVTEKAMRIVQTWGMLFPDELSTYTALYIKYKKKGVIFHLPEPTDMELTTRNGNTFEICIEHVTESSLLIDDIINNLHHGFNRQAVESLYTHANEIKQNFTGLLEVYCKSKISDEQHIVQLQAIETDFENKIALLYKILYLEEHPNNDLVFRTYTTGHLTESEETIHNSPPKQSTLEPMKHKKHSKHIQQELPQTSFEKSTRKCNDPNRSSLNFNFLFSTLKKHSHPSTESVSLTQPQLLPSNQIRKRTESFRLDDSYDF